jgi:putative tributyrin esterase
MITALLLLVIGLPLSGEPTVTEDSLYSPRLHRTMHYRVLVSDPSEEAMAHPTLVLLHGYTGNHRNWTDLTRLRDVVAGRHIVIVMPHGENSWYVNAVSDSAGPYEDALLTDLLPAVIRNFPIDTTRMGIAGLSMGGYGALSLGLRHPHTFRFIGSLSGSLDVPFLIPDLERNGRAGLKASLEHIFGRDTTFWAAHAPFRLAASMPASDAPYFYLANGIQDEFTRRLYLYRDFADLLHSRSLRYEYHETPGRHSWDYWEQEIPGVIQRFLEIVR